jgi:hypothetical protein
MAGGADGTVAERAAGESAIAPVASRYRRREPERTLLHATVRAHWKTFLGRHGNRATSWVDGVMAQSSHVQLAVRGTVAFC